MTDRLVSAHDLANREYDGIPLPGVYGKLLGEIEPGTYILIWGPPGAASLRSRSGSPTCSRTGRCST